MYLLGIGELCTVAFVVDLREDVKNTLDLLRLAR